MAGHLFIIRGDIRGLACDAWLLPTDRRQHISEVWKRAWPRAFEVPVEPDVLPDWKKGSMRPWPEWPEDRSPPWLVAVGGATALGAEWPAATAGRFIETVADHLRGRPPRHGRARHLVALPVLGTGSGGQRQRAGDVLQALIPVLTDRAKACDLDVALVTLDHETFAAARAVRGTGAVSWPELDADELARTRALATIAGKGELVLFMGAGVSVGAGMPDWKRLVNDLAMEVGIDPEAGGWGDLDITDQASIIGRRLPSSAALGERVAARFTRPEASLQHFLLASLPVTEAVTTNYDDLFELASGPGTVSVIPHAPASSASRWLLKMHGCVTRPQDVVLTRADYLRYEQRRVALAGIVQAMLMTRHMLFVGFSLKDENFHKVADAVRRARDPEQRSGRRRFGTVLKLASETFVEELWSDDLDFVSTGAALPSGLAGADRQRAHAERSRRLEILLDSLLAQAPIDPLHFLHDRFSGSLTGAEKAFRDEIAALLDRLPTDARSGPAWERLQQLVAQLGGPSGRRGA